MSQIAAHQDKRHKTGNHSNPERFDRITMQCVELNPSRIGRGYLVDWQLHRCPQSAHPCSDPPVSESSRQRNHAETDALNDQIHPRLRLPPHQRSDEQ